MYIINSILYRIRAGAALLLLLAVSCAQFEDANEAREVEPLNTVVKVSLNIGDAPDPGTLNVKLVNYSERFEATASVDQSGSVKVAGIIPGIYTQLPLC